MEPGTERSLATELAELAEGLGTALGKAAAMQPVRIGPTAREAVLRREQYTLYRYRGAETVPAHPIPVLIVYSLVNRPYLLDLHQRRSLIARLVEAGLQVYLIEWKDPEPADRYLSLEDYISGFIGEAQRWIRREHDLPAASLLGVCQGGTLATCFAALQPEHVHCLVNLATPIDFARPANALARMARHLDVDTLIEAWGNIPSDQLNTAFVSLSPFRLSVPTLCGVRPPGGRSGRNGGLPAHGTVDVRQPRPGWRGIPRIHHGLLSAESPEHGTVGYWG